MPAIFISYRRQDTEQIVASIYNFVAEAFGAETIFVDTASIVAGDDFMRSIEQNLASAKILLVVIGGNWLGTNADGTRRIDQLDDLVRAEVRMGLQLARQGQLTVIPLLVDATPMPRVEQLPSDLSDLPLQNAEQIHSSLRYFKYDINRLLDTIGKVGVPRRKQGPIEKAPNRFRLLPGAAVITAGISLGAVRLSRQAIILATTIITILLAGTVIVINSNPSIFARTAEATPTPYSNSTATPYSTPTDTPTPIPTPDKGELSSWRVLPLTTTKSQAYNAIGPMEGYTEFDVEYGVENLTSAPLFWPAPDGTAFILQATVNNTSQTYQDECPANSSLPQPPEYWLVYRACFTAPSVATNASFTATSSSTQGSAELASWSLDSEVNGSVRLPADPSDGMLAVGTTFTNPGVMEYTLTKISIQRWCIGKQTGWQLNITHSLKNIGGVDISGPNFLEVFYDQGNWTDDSGFYDRQTSFLNVAPGVSQTADTLFDLTFSDHSTEVCSQTAIASLWPKIPSGLRIFAMFRDLSTNETSWVVYNLGTPPVLSTILVR